MLILVKSISFFSHYRQHGPEPLSLKIRANFQPCYTRITTITIKNEYKHRLGKVSVTRSGDLCHCSTYCERAPKEYGEVLHTSVILTKKERWWSYIEDNYYYDWLYEEYDFHFHCTIRTLKYSHEIAHVTLLWLKLSLLQRLRIFVKHLRIR